MKTVQATLKYVDEKELIDNYLEAYPISVDDFDEKITIGDAKRYCRYRLHEYISRLKQMKIKPDKNQGIFFVQRVMKDEMGDTDYDLVFVDDLKKYGLAARSYAFEFTPQNEIMGWWIADNELTQTYLIELLVYILEEASFFGYKQEGLQKELDKIERGMKQVKENPDSLVSFDSAEEIFNFDKQTDKEEKLETKAFRAELEYSEYSRKKELTEIMRKLDLKN